MDLFERLAVAIEHEQNQGELPDFLVTPLQQVAANPQRYGDQTKLVTFLLTQLNDFDPYSGCGCFAEGYNAQDVITTLDKLGITIDGATPASCQRPE